MKNLVLTLLAFLIFVFASAARSQSGSIDLPSVSDVRFDWKDFDISVCFAEPTSSEGMRAIVRNAVEETWMRHSGLVFQGWGTCEGRKSDIRVLIYDHGTEGLWPKSNIGTVSRFGISRESYRRQGGPIETNIYAKYSSILPSMFLAGTGFCGDRNDNKCLHVQSVHEFGHAIAMLHEQDRDDTPEWCDRRLGFDQADLDARIRNQPYLNKHSRTWDSDSVMNYCSTVWTNNGELTALDIAGVQELYPKDVNRRPTHWQQVPGTLKQVSVGSANNVWGVNSQDQIYRNDGDGWQQISGGLKQVSVGCDGSVWGVNSSDQIFRRSGETWRQIPGGLKQVSVGAGNNVWGVNSQDQIYRRDGEIWRQVSGELKQISVGCDGAVWGVDSLDQIYRRNKNAWQQIPGGLIHVSVGTAKHVWGTNVHDEIWRYVDGVWKKVSGGLTQNSVGADGEVWGVDRDGNIFKTF